MSIQPTLQFSFSPTCETFSCLCCKGTKEEDEKDIYHCKNGKFKSVTNMTDDEIIKSDERFRVIIERKLDPLPLNTNDFIDRLQNEEGVSLKVTRDYPLTKARLEFTIETINRMLGELHVD